MRDMIAVTKLAWEWCPLLVFSPVVSNVPVDENSEKGICDNGALFGGSVFRQVRGIQRKPLLAFAVFEMPSAQNNQIQVAYLGVICFELLQSIPGSPT